MKVSDEVNIFIKDASKYYAHYQGNSPNDLYIAFKKSNKKNKEMNVPEVFMANYKNILDEEILRNIYSIGQEDYFIKISFGEFLECIIFNKYTVKQSNQPITFRWRRFNASNHPFRHKNKYVRKKEHIKKEETEEEALKNEWREHSGLNKDNAKYYGKSRKQYAKKQSNRSIRREERTNARLQSENTSDYDHKKFKNNHWMWD